MKTLSLFLDLSHSLFEAQNVVENFNMNACHMAMEHGRFDKNGELSFMDNTIR